MRYKFVSIKHIAERLQLSLGTVSSALRDDSRVKNSTKEKVREMAEQLGYIKDWRNYAKGRKKKPANGEVTIYDIADRLQLSAATVSRALNGSEKVKRATVKKIKATAIELGYTVNIDARQLRTKAVTNKLSQKQNVTISIIANKLGISAATVSRAFTENSRISPRTKVIVLRAASEMGFVPYENARKLRVNRNEQSLSWNYCLQCRCTKVCPSLA